MSGLRQGFRDPGQRAMGVQDQAEGNAVAYLHVRLEMLSELREELRRVQKTERWEEDKVEERQVIVTRHRPEEKLPKPYREDGD